ncbi:Transposase [Piscirickettsia salmonis]|uniref:IS66 family transposase n=1 Tax=Piscirickettsia salmonis TaxID=1238 RepID=UPI0012BACE75|nr:IS66 family transposase [Piscirickettsia salmonis]QGP53383.1 Transposase [Piscirickettsia salmonis]QGP60697.1 Transposase [Piscirickettsia salmonis]QGP62948.1 Transposase [Piscirickettsia salmonis]
METAVYPENIEDCYKVIDHVSTERDHYKALYEQLQRYRYGQRSEKLSQDQLDLFAEFLDENAEKESQQEAITVPAHQRQRPKRKPLPEHLPRERIEHDLTEGDKVCACGCAMQRIGEEITEKLEVIPAQFKVIQHVRFKYGCKACETGIKIPSLPPMLIPKSIITPSLLAMIVSDKFESHLPLHRQQQRFEALGIDLPRNTMANWVIVTAMLCESLLELMKQDLLQAKLIHADESPLRVLSEGKQKSYLWYYYGRIAEKQICCIDFQASRHSIHPAKFLKGYTGYMMTDAYSGYGEVIKNEKITSTYCWSHARRKFEAIPQPKKDSKKITLAMEMLNLIKELYRIEKEIKGKSPDIIYQHRQEKSKPILDEIKQWLEHYQPSIPPKVPLGQAMSYLHKNWNEFIRYIDEPFLSIDNNVLERQIRPLAVGRHNWLFSASEAGAQATAAFYSLVATCAASHGVLSTG